MAISLVTPRRLLHLYRYMKRAHFPSWARPGEFHARLNQRLGRREEARDSARVALYTPWWTLKYGFTSMAEIAQFPASADEVDRLLTEVTKSSQGGALPAGIAVAVKTDEQVILTPFQYNEVPRHSINSFAKIDIRLRWKCHPRPER